MSYAWKRFIQGPSLHEGTGSTRHSSKSKSTESVSEDDGKTAEYYQEIINLPSTACTVSVDTTRRKLSLRSSQRRPPAPSKLPSFHQLLKLAQENKVDELESSLNVHENINLDRTDEFGWTLLMVSACAGSSDCVSLLLEKGSNWKIVDKKGLNAFSLARKNQRKQVCQLIQKWEALQGQLKAFEQEKDSSKSVDSCSSKSIAVPDFCEPCVTQVIDSAKHSKSIAHLLSTSKDFKETTHYGIPESNIGFQLMIRTGWDKNSGLGPEGKGQKFPVKTILKQDRIGLGTGEIKKARVTHFAAFDTAAVERQVKPGERLERKRTTEKKAQALAKHKQRTKEINYRRELGSV